MKMQAQIRKVHGEKLADLGFSAEEIAAAEAMEREGLYEMEPSADLVDRTIARCAELLRPQEARVDEVPYVPHPAPVLASYVAALKELSPSLLQMPEWGSLSRLQELQEAFLATVHFAHARRGRPVVMLDNHNLLEPKWWSEDTGFRAIRSACQIANKAALEAGVSPAAVVEVLRPRIEEYTDSDLAAIEQLLRDCTADLWWLPYGSAGTYRHLDCIVLGEERSLVLEAKADTPFKALEAFRDSHDQNAAVGLRRQLESIAKTGFQILAQGQPTKEAAGRLSSLSDIRELLGQVIVKASVTAA